MVSFSRVRGILQSTNAECDLERDAMDKENTIVARQKADGTLVPTLKELLLADQPRDEIPPVSHGRYRQRNPKSLDDF
jgi:hypothetical protein